MITDKLFALRDYLLQQIPYVRLSMADSQAEFLRDVRSVNAARRPAVFLLPEIGKGGLQNRVAILAAGRKNDDSIRRIFDKITEIFPGNGTEIKIADIRWVRKKIYVFPVRGHGKIYSLTLRTV